MRAQPMRLFVHSVSRARRIAAACAIVAAALGSAPQASAAPDAAALIGRLLRRPPATIAFTEVRFSELLVEPLVVGGLLDYTADGALTRRVETPYRESTAIRAETVRIERDGEKPRTFALRRAPELRGFVTGMLGLLTGDSGLIDEHFGVTANGDDDYWRLELVPRDDRLQQRLRNIIVTGRMNEPRCFTIVDTQGGTSVMLLGEAAALALPQRITLAELLGRCAE
jgi:hypothetical protein